MKYSRGVGDSIIRHKSSAKQHTRESKASTFSVYFGGEQFDIILLININILDAYMIYVCIYEYPFIGYIQLKVKTNENARLLNILFFVLTKWSKTTVRVLPPRNVYYSINPLLVYPVYY